MEDYDMGWGWGAEGFSSPQWSPLWPVCGRQGVTAEHRMGAEGLTGQAEEPPTPGLAGEGGGWWLLRVKNMCRVP